SCTSSSSSVTYTLSLHDALPICDYTQQNQLPALSAFTSDGCNCMRYSAIFSASSSDSSGYIPVIKFPGLISSGSCNHFTKFSFVDRKSTRLNSSHVSISYAVFCL